MGLTEYFKFFAIRSGPFSFAWIRLVYLGHGLCRFDIYKGMKAASDLSIISEQANRVRP